MFLRKPWDRVLLPTRVVCGSGELLSPTAHPGYTRQPPSPKMNVSGPVPLGTPLTLSALIPVPMCCWNAVQEKVKVCVF